MFRSTKGSFRIQVTGAVSIGFSYYLFLVKSLVSDWVSPVTRTLSEDSRLSPGVVVSHIRSCYRSVPLQSKRSWSRPGNKR